MIAFFGALLTAGWLAVALAGGTTAGTLHLSALAAAVGCGATALATTVPGRRRRDAFLVPVLLVVLPAAAALAVGGHTALALLGCVAVCVLSTKRQWRPAGWSLAAGGVGLGLTAAGLALGRNDLHAGVLQVEGELTAALLAAAAAALILAAALAPEDEDGLRVLVLPGLVIGWVVAPMVTGATGVAAALALLTAVLVTTRQRPAPLAFAALALAAVGPARPAAALLGAAAVLVTALGPVLAWPTVLPGSVAAALALAAGPGRVEQVAAGIAVGIAVLALTRTIRGPAVLAPRFLPAAALALWLAIAPATWVWAGAARLGDYQEGAARAVAAALLVTVMAWMTGQLRPPAPEWRNDGW
ncbi:MAG: hypothetical protein QOG87_3834 [Actinomycetota bacterium]